MRKPSIWFWIVAGLFLLWNIFGCYLYIAEMTMSDVQYADVYGAEKAAVRDIYPAWAVAAYAIAVWGGLLAALLLLLRKRFTAPVFVLSLVAAAICFIPVFTSTPLRESGGDRFWVMPAIVIIVGVIELWFARQKIAQGIIR